MSDTSNAAKASDAPATVVESNGAIAPETNNVAKFAALLRSERAGDDPSPDATGTQPKPPSAAGPRALDQESLLAAWKAGDERKMAELLGEDPRDVKVGNSRYAEFRRTVRAKEESLASEREEITKERQKVEQERHALQQSTGVLREAAQHLQAGDYGAFIEVATGKPLAEILETLARELVDPSQRDLRKLRADMAERDRRAEAERAQLQQQLEQRQQQEARTTYLRDLRSELEKDADTSLFLAEYGDEFVAAVFAEQQRAWDGQRTITAAKAVERVLAAQLQKHQRLSGVLDKRAGKTTVATSRDSKQTAAQGTRGARLTSRSVDTTRSQGGASTTSRVLTKQENIAAFAAQLRREHDLG